MIDPPTDRRFDRRAFLRHMSALTAAASTGALGVLGGPAPLTGAVRGRPGAATSTLPRPAQFEPPADAADLTLAQASAMLRAGTLSPVELVEACLARVERFDPVYLAFNTVLAEQAREGARVLERRGGGGALHGIPLALKDNFYTAGVPTTANSHIFADFVPETDAEAWVRLRDHGAVLVGKTQMGPLATSRATTPDGLNTTLNAWAPGHPSVSPGGRRVGPRRPWRRVWPWSRPAPRPGARSRIRRWSRDSRASSRPWGASR